MTDERTPCRSPRASTPNDPTDQGHQTKRIKTEESVRKSGHVSRRFAEKSPKIVALLLDIFKSPPAPTPEGTGGNDRPREFDLPNGIIEGRVRWGCCPLEGSIPFV